jgi:hypothetical protein
MEPLKHISKVCASIYTSHLRLHGQDKDRNVPTPLYILGEKYRTLSSSLCSFLHSPVTSSLLGPNTLLNTLFWSTPAYVPPSISATKFHAHTKNRQNYSSVYRYNNCYNYKMCKIVSSCTRTLLIVCFIVNLTISTTNSTVSLHYVPWAHTNVWVHACDLSGSTRAAWSRSSWMVQHGLRRLCAPTAHNVKRRRNLAWKLSGVW